MAKFGKRSVVSDKLEDYVIGVIGEGGIGKTTLMCNICEEYLGADGYMLLNCGKEDGMKCLDGYTYETVLTYKQWDAVTSDIVKNKNTDYPNLKVIIIDTLDQLCEFTEPEIIRRWNNDNIGVKDFKPAKTINGVYGGFGRGEDMVYKVILERLWELKAVGVNYWYTGHVKSREVVDPLTNTTYTSLTTNMMQKYFTAFKTKSDVLGVACIDREIVKEGLGRKNIMTKKEETRNKIVNESRVIKFRDDNYSVDSKSRFANIVDQIPLESNAFINAIKDAIAKAKNPNAHIGITPNSTTKVETPITEETPIDTDETPVEETTETVDKSALMDDIRTRFKSAGDDTKKQIKAILKEKGSGKLDDSLEIDVLNEISAILDDEV